MTARSFTYPFYCPPRHRSGPYLPILIRNPHTDKEIEWPCLIDTGADSSLFPASVCALTGHDLKGEGVASDITCGVEGRLVKTWQHTFALDLLSPDGKTVVWTCTNLIECTAYDGLPPILGTTDFLSHFDIELSYRRQTVRMKPYL